jgi:hypothetical protein
VVATPQGPLSSPGQETLGVAATQILLN